MAYIILNLNRLLRFTNSNFRKISQIEYQSCKIYFQLLSSKFPSLKKIFPTSKSKNDNAQNIKLSVFLKLNVKYNDSKAFREGNLKYINATKSPI